MFLNCVLHSVTDLLRTEDMRMKMDIRKLLERMKVDVRKLLEMMKVDMRKLLERVKVDLRESPAR